MCYIMKAGHDLAEWRSHFQISELTCFRTHDLIISNIVQSSNCIHRNGTMNQTLMQSKQQP